MYRLITCCDCGKTEDYNSNEKPNPKWVCSTCYHKIKQESPSYFTDNGRGVVMGGCFFSLR